MFKKLFAIISLIIAGVFSYFAIDSLAELWIFPVVLFGTNIVCIAVFALSLYLLTFYIKDDAVYNKPNKFYHYYLAYSLEYICCCLCRVKLKVIGLDKLPKDKKYLIVQNHRSNLDPMVNYFALRKHNVSFISKPENFKLFVVGKFITRTGNIPLNRENNREGIKAILRAVELIKSDQFSIMVCPEGTRNKFNTNILPFKSGTFKIAQKADVPVVISSINGTEKAMKRFPWRSTTVTIKIIDVVNPKDFESTTELSEHAEKLIAEDLGVIVHTEEEVLMLKEGTYNPNTKQLPAPVVENKAESTTENQDETTLQNIQHETNETNETNEQPTEKHSETIIDEN